MKKIFTVMMTVCLGLVSVGCTGSGTAPKANEASTGLPGATGTTTTSKDSGKVTEVRVSWYGDANRTKIYNDTFDIIQKKLPDLKLVREFAASGEYWTKLNTQVAGGNAPDLMIFTLDTLYDFAKRGQLLDLQPFADQGIIHLNDFNPAIVNSGKVDGKLYTVSQGNSILGSYYNKDLFKKAGVSEPDLNWTWDDFSKAMIAIHTSLGKNVWGSEDLAGVNNVFQTFLKQKNKDLYKEDGSLGFEKSDMIEWFTLWDNMRQQGGIPPADISAEYKGKNEVESILAAGKVAVSMSASNRLKLFQNVMKDELGMVRVPNVKGGTQFDLLAGVYMGIYTKSKFPKETARIIDAFANDSEAAKAFGLLYGPVGSSKVMKELEPSIDPLMKKVNDFQVTVSKNVLPTVPYPTGSNAVNKLLSTENDAVAFKQKTVAQSVDDFFTEAQKILKK
ncbi:multiple sugar transport system substrate-binding protein [Paenibacillus sp. 1_12]|uniref:ABC transporter substrate-binding protein n=1 Tax=Paenibacillus sp. 1_12 TaxID=1566278 RepID=UPI0008E343AF|nr:extracellular solute-binding protein [Paenibacillus sp. 1_12]SFK99578.1 multiple sugar transport system substrate-binding protein [Paenibacillus sp. 1_12]